MTLASEIISGMKERMVKTNNAVCEALTEISEMKASLDETEKKLKKQYEEDREYLLLVCGDDGTNSSESSDTIDT